MLAALVEDRFRNGAALPQGLGALEFLVGKVDGGLGNVEAGGRFVEERLE